MNKSIKEYNIKFDECLRDILLNPTPTIEELKKQQAQNLKRLRGLNLWVLEKKYPILIIGMSI